MDEGWSPRAWAALESIRQENNREAEEKRKRWLFTDLDAALKDAEKPGAFAACGFDTSGLPRVPLLAVEGLEDYLAVPLPSAQARELIAISERAAFGRGEATVVDATVREAWKVPGARCRFDNAMWAPALSALVQRARVGLGVGQKVRAELHDLLVYEAGGHFRPHRDSEKAPGMFGTLVVSWPSKHAGGALEVRHQGRTVRFESAKGDLCGYMPWCAFFADCEHEIERVESGYRVALTYNLVRADAGGPAPAPPSKAGVAHALAAVAEKWAAAPVELDWDKKPKKWTEGSGDAASLAPDKACHFLDHAYTKASIEAEGWGVLKGTDAATAGAVAASGAFDVFLCTVEVTESGDDDRSFSEGHGDEREWKFEGWVPPPGTTLPDVINDQASDLEVAGDECRQVDFKYDHCYEEDGGYPTGNEGCPYTRWYKCAALVFWPKARRAFLGAYAAAELIDAALEGEGSARAGYGSNGAIAKASASLAAIDVSYFCDKVLNVLVRSLALDGAVEPSTIISFVAEKLELDVLPSERFEILEHEFEYILDGVKRNRRRRFWDVDGAKIASALCGARDRFAADDAARLDDAWASAAKRGAAKEGGGAFAVWRVLDALLADAGESAARLVAAAAGAIDALVDSLVATASRAPSDDPSLLLGLDYKERDAAKLAAETPGAALAALKRPAAAPIVEANAARLRGIPTMSGLVPPVPGPEPAKASESSKPEPAKAKKAAKAKAKPTRSPRKSEGAPRKSRRS